MERAEPSGDCTADALNELRATGWLAAMILDLDIDQEADGTVRLRFVAPGSNPQSGFWPLEYVGIAAADGVVEAVVPQSQVGSRRFDPWGDFCTWDWSTQGGFLRATFSADRRLLQGTVVESYRVEAPPGGPIFTIHSSFVAHAP
jgi:hypothetical protein